MEFISAPSLETERLILRKLAEQDIDALFAIHSDPEVNTYLPWFPLKVLEEARVLFETECGDVHRWPRGYCYAVCLKSDQIPIGYVSIGIKAPYDPGYGLRREFWYNGIISEACRAVIRQLKRDGFLYITATHGVNNLRSGEVMERLGMSCKCTYEEQWQPKDVLVTFRMYQLNFDGQGGRVYEGYWDRWTVHLIKRDTYDIKEEKGLK